MKLIDTRVCFLVFSSAVFGREYDGDADERVWKNQYGRRDDDYAGRHQSGIRGDEILAAVRELSRVFDEKFSQLKFDVDGRVHDAIDSMEDLKDEMSEVKATINSRFAEFQAEAATKEELQKSTRLISERMDDLENKVTKLSRDSIEQVRGLGDDIRRGMADRRQQASRSDHEEPRSKKSHVEKPQLIQVSQPREAQVVRQPARPQTPRPPTPKKTRPSSLVSKFQLIRHSDRIELPNSRSIFRSTGKDRTPANAYSDAFPTDSPLVFTWTLQVKELRGVMEFGINLINTVSELRTESWRANYVNSAIWYSGGSFATNRRRTRGWPRFARGDVVGVSYQPSTGLLEFHRNGKFVNRTYKDVGEFPWFNFGLTLYIAEDEVSVTESKVQTEDEYRAAR